MSGAVVLDQRPTGTVPVKPAGPSLARLVDAVGTHVLDIVVGDPDAGGPVSCWSIHDTLDPAPMVAGAVVLGIGLVDQREIVAVAERLSADGAEALVLRSGTSLDGPARGSLAATSLVVLSLANGTSWQQLCTSLRAEIDELSRTDEVPSVAFGGLPISDLFSLANAICVLIDAPVTIEDRSSRVLAFSDRQDEADPARIATVLGRQTPQLYVRGDEERGVMRMLRQSERPLFIEPGEAEDPHTALPRVAVAVRAGGELLGFIWAVVREPLSVECEDLLVEASRLAAVQLLDARTGPETSRRNGMSMLMTAVLEGTADAEDALDRLGFVRQPCVVVAIGEPILPTNRPPDRVFGSKAAELARRNAERRRIASAFAVHLASVWPGSVIAESGDRIYALLPVEPTDAVQESVARTCRTFLSHIGRGLSAIIGVGTRAADLTTIPDSRAAADRALRVLHAAEAVNQVATNDEVDDQAWLLELKDLIVHAGARPSGAFARLLAYDEARGSTAMVATLDAWLSLHGDVQGAAVALHVHENTLRYRLRRIGEIGRVDLTDADSRLILAMQLMAFGRDSQA